MQTNELRGVLYEFAIVLPEGHLALLKALPGALTEAKGRLPTMLTDSLDEQVRRIESVLTVCDGKIVYAAGDYAELAPAIPSVSPDWSPVGRYGCYQNEAPAAHAERAVFGADGRLWEMGCGCA